MSGCEVSVCERQCGQCVCVSGYEQSCLPGFGSSLLDVAVTDRMCSFVYVVRCVSV